MQIKLYGLPKIDQDTVSSFYEQHRFYATRATNPRPLTFKEIYRSTGFYRLSQTSEAFPGIDQALAAGEALVRFATTNHMSNPENDLGTANRIADEAFQHFRQNELAYRSQAEIDCQRPLQG